MAVKNAIKFYKSATYATATGNSKVSDAVYFTQLGTDNSGAHAVVLNGVAYGYGDPMTASRLGVAKVGYTTTNNNFGVSIDTSSNLYVSIPSASSDTLGVVKLGSVAADNTGVITGGAVYSYTHNAIKSLATSVATADSAATVTLTSTALDNTAATTTFSLKGVGMSVANTGTAITLTADVQGVGDSGYLKLADSKIDIDTDKIKKADDTTSYSNTNLATAGYVEEKVAGAIAGGVKYKGTATIDATAPTSPANGDMYKVVANGDRTKGTVFGVDNCKAGDILIAVVSGKSTEWTLIPSGDDVEYTGIYVGDTPVVTATAGGDANFVAGTGLVVSGETGKVTYSHGTIEGASKTDTESFVKIKTDVFGHVNGTAAVAKSDITGLLGDYVESFGGATGTITLKAASTTNGTVNLKMDSNTLGASIVGLGSAAFTASTDYAKATHTHAISDVTDLQTALDGKQAKITDGSATIASISGNVVTLKAGVAQTDGAISNSDAGDITLATVAKTGAAADVTFTPGESGIKSTDVNAAIIEVNSNIGTKIADLDVDTFNLASVSGNTLTINNIKEVDGKIAKDNESSISFTNDNQTIKVGDTTFGTNDAVAIAGDAGITVYADTANKKITVKHSNNITGDTVGSASQIPVITYDAYGHITKAEAIDVVSAADGKMTVGDTQIFSANTSNNTTISAAGAVGLTATAAGTSTAASLTIGVYWED